MAASYLKGIDWIAANDEPTERNPVTVSEMISATLLAELFDKEPLEVGLDVVKARKNGNVSPGHKVKKTT